MSDPGHLQVGERIAGRYVVERVLGRGGMGVVVAARHVELGQLFAIKFLLPEATGDAAATERLLREARSAARLGSAHVARVTDVGRTERGDPFLVMEYLDGTDLHALLAARGPLPAADAARVVIEACDAIGEAHAAGIVHRDLKPANLFLARRPDGTTTIKVLDFGIAKESAGLATASMTATGAVFGSPVYMAPEQVRSAKHCTPASDIWALGVTLYELVTGAIPFDATSVTELIAAILTDPPVPPSARRQGVPPALEAIILRCLERDPARRFRTASELAAALAPIARGAAHPAGPSPTTMPSLGGRLPADVAFAASGSQTAAPTSTSIARGGRGSTILHVALATAGGLLLAAVGAFAVTRPWEPDTTPSAAAPVAEVRAAPPASQPLGTAEPTVTPAGPPGSSTAPSPASSASPATVDAAPSASAPPSPGTTDPSAAAPKSTPPPRPARPRSSAATPPPPPAKTGWGGLL